MLTRTWDVWTWLGAYANPLEGYATARADQQHGFHEFRVARDAQGFARLHVRATSQASSWLPEGEGVRLFHTRPPPDSTPPAAAFRPPSAWNQHEIESNVRLWLPHVTGSRRSGEELLSYDEAEREWAEVWRRLPRGGDASNLPPPASGEAFEPLPRLSPAAASDAGGAAEAAATSSLDEVENPLVSPLTYRGRTHNTVARETNAFRAASRAAAAAAGCEAPIYAADYLLAVDTAGVVALYRVIGAPASGSSRVAEEIKCTVYEHTQQAGVPGLFGDFEKKRNPTYAKSARGEKQWVTMPVRRGDIVVYNVQTHRVGSKEALRLDADSLRALERARPSTHLMPKPLPASHATATTATAPKRKAEADLTVAPAAPAAATGPKEKASKAKAPKAPRKETPLQTPLQPAPAPSPSAPLLPPTFVGLPVHVHSSSRWHANSCWVDALLQLLEAIDTHVRALNASAGALTTIVSAKLWDQLLTPQICSSRGAVMVDVAAAISEWLRQRRVIASGDAPAGARDPLDAARDHVRDHVLRGFLAPRKLAVASSAQEIAQEVLKEMGECGSTAAALSLVMRPSAHVLTLRFTFPCVNDTCKAPSSASTYSSAMTSLLAPSLLAANGDVLAAISAIGRNDDVSASPRSRHCPTCHSRCLARMTPCGQSRNDRAWRHAADAPVLLLVELPESRTEDASVVRLTGADVARSVQLLTSDGSFLDVAYSLIAATFHRGDHFATATLSDATAGSWLWFDGIADKGVGQPCEAPTGAPIERDGHVWRVVLVAYGRRVV